MASLKSQLQHSITPIALRSYIAEFISTFLIVFASIGAATFSWTPSAASDPASLTAVATESAFALSVAVYISVGHVNPAGTFAMAVCGHITIPITIPMAILYSISHMLASVTACLVLKTLTLNQRIPVYTVPNEMTGFGGSILEGVIITFGLVYAFSDSRIGPWGAIAPLVVGLVLGANVLASGPFTGGGSMNPASAFGAGVVGGSLKNEALYWVGLLVGGAVAGVVLLVYDNVVCPDQPSDSGRGSAEVSTNGFEFLPQEIIRCIQSLLHRKDSKEAARTALISKSWHRTWCTRSDLVFDRNDQFPGRPDAFRRFAMTTMRRYIEVGTSIHRLKLYQRKGRMEQLDRTDLDLATELTVQAIESSVSHLSIELSIDFLITFHSEYLLIFPTVEVLGSKTLISLSLCGGFSVDFRARGVVVDYSNLKILTLKDLRIVDGDVVSELISRCPLIEELTLDSLKTNPGELVNIRIQTFDRLKYLYLRDLDFSDILTRSDWCPRFSRLTELVISGDVYRCTRVRINSPSLERVSITLSGYKGLNAKFDVPNMQKFKYSASPMHCLKFSTRPTYEKWESDIQTDFSPTGPSYIEEWFNVLHKSVEELSRVSLTISVERLIRMVKYKQNGMYGLGKPVAVEKLTIKGKQVPLAFLDDVLRCFPPNLLRIEAVCLEGKKDKTVEEFEKLQSLPWEALFNGSNKIGEFVQLHISTV